MWTASMNIVLLIIAHMVTTASTVLPEQLLTTPGIIEYWNYKAEIHTVKTDDGYILTLHRIPFGKKGAPGKRPLAFLQHGLEGDSSNWVVNLPTQSLAFILADAGYDVWMGNFRGNTYSTNHVSLPPSSKEFWQFSWDEMAEHDLPAMLNYALHAANASSLHYIGHSQGTMTAFALFAEEYTTWGRKVSSMHAMGPVAKVGHIKGMLSLIAPYANDAAWLLQAFGDDQFVPTSTTMKWMKGYLCGLLNGTNTLCDDLLFLIGGPDSHQLNQTRVPVYMSHSPGGTSTMNMQHFGQCVNSNKFCKFDWLSSEENQAHYGQPAPPDYNLTKVTVPVYLHWGQLDILADPTDVEYISSTLQRSTLKANNGYADFNHLDFIYGMKANVQVYSRIITEMKQH